MAVQQYSSVSRQCTLFPCKNDTHVFTPNILPVLLETKRFLKHAHPSYWPNVVRCRMLVLVTTPHTQIALTRCEPRAPPISSLSRPRLSVSSALCRFCTSLGPVLIMASIWLRHLSYLHRNNTITTVATVTNAHATPPCMHDGCT